MQIDTVIIGSGPIGLYTAFRLGLSNIDNVVIETLEKVGGQCSNLYNEKFIYDLPGIVAIPAANLIDNLLTQVNSLNKTNIIKGNTVVDVVEFNGGFKVITDTGLVIDTKFVIIASGAGVFEHRKPIIKGIECICDKVRYSVTDKSEYTGKSLMVLGGGDSALDWVSELNNICSNIYLVHRSSSFRANAALVESIKSYKNVSIFLGTVVNEVFLKDNKIHCLLRTIDSETTVSVDNILVFYGMISTSNTFSNWCIKINVENNKIPVDPVTSITNIDNVYCVGDVSTYNKRQNNLISGFFQSVYVANEIKRKLNKESA